MTKEENTIRFLIHLKRNKFKLTVNQYKTIKGQAVKGELDSAVNGYNKIIDESY